MFVPEIGNDQNTSKYEKKKKKNERDAVEFHVPRESTVARGSTVFR